MNYKKIIPLILVIFLLIGCEKNEIIEDEIIDYRYSESYTGTETDYENKYNAMSGEWQYLPNIHTKFYPESFELYHQYTYEDGSVKREWKECTRTEYEIEKERLKWKQ